MAREAWHPHLQGGATWGLRTPLPRRASSALMGGWGVAVSCWGTKGTPGRVGPGHPEWGSGDEREQGSGPIEGQGWVSAVGPRGAHAPCLPEACLSWGCHPKDCG